MNIPLPLLGLWIGIYLCPPVSGSLYCEVSGEDTVCKGVPRRNIFNGSILVKDHGDIRIDRTKIMPFGPAQCAAFNNARYVTFYGTDLNEVPVGCFDSFQHLEGLGFTSNPIKVVREGTFPNILKLQHGKDSGQNSGIKSNLKQLGLFANEIHTIEDNAFMAESLESLNLGMNKIKDITNKFKHLSGLESLNLDNNEIEFLKRESFLGLTSLRKLDLSVNPIKDISDDAFVGLRNLSRLDLSFTGLTTLNMFQRINTAEGSSDMLPSLRDLDLWFNKIKDITNKFKDLSGLIYLNLGTNEIEYLTKDSFVGLTSLRSLDLSSNPIKQISDDAFFWLKSLEDLDLNYTDLTALDIFFRPQNTGALQNLQDLDVDDNKLESLPECLFTALPSIEWIDLDDNPWRCDENIKPLQEAIKAGKMPSWSDGPECLYPESIKGTKVKDYEAPSLNTTSETTVDCKVMITQMRSSTQGLRSSTDPTPIAWSETSVWNDTRASHPPITTPTTNTTSLEMPTPRPNRPTSKAFTIGVPVLVLLAITICLATFLVRM